MRMGLAAAVLCGLLGCVDFGGPSEGDGRDYRALNACRKSHERCAAATWEGCGGTWQGLDPAGRIVWQAGGRLEGDQSRCYEREIDACDSALDSCSTFEESRLPKS